MALRVAIYTRKSTEEGLDQEFNSLHAQREACEAFILSQRELGWKVLPDAYDDGGLSGGTMDRPALAKLLEDVRANRIDVVVVYKIDRLTRSLMDFSKIVEIFDQNGVSFVSVTQQFNTSTSMGRLTLNMLLSFAQFEREVTAERIRDKIAASKKKGMWMGGLVPLGYDAIDRKLLINEKEAENIRWLFRTYLELRSVRQVKKLADEKGIRSKLRERSQQRQRGGVKLSRGIIYRMLQNPIYKGCVRHNGNIYPGLHDAIIDEELFEAVQARIKSQAQRNRFERNTVTEPHLLTGLLIDETGDRLSPTHGAKNGRRYRYYISHRLVQGNDPDSTAWRLPAKPMERIVLSKLIEIFRNPVGILDWVHISNTDLTVIKSLEIVAGEIVSALKSDNAVKKRKLLATIIKQIQVTQGKLTLTFDREALLQSLCIKNEQFEQAKADDPTIELPMTIRRRGVESRIIVEGTSQNSHCIEANLVRLIAQAHHFMDCLTSGNASSISQLANQTGTNASDISRILPLAFLAPDITRGILEGNQPPELTARFLKRIPDLPLNWEKQRERLGFCQNRA